MCNQLPPTLLTFATMENPPYPPKTIHPFCHLRREGENISAISEYNPSTSRLGAPGEKEKKGCNRRESPWERMRFPGEIFPREILHSAIFSNPLVGLK